MLNEGILDRPTKEQPKEQLETAYFPGVYKVHNKLYKESRSLEKEAYFIWHTGSGKTIYTHDFSFERKRQRNYSLRQGKRSSLSLFSQLDRLYTVIEPLDVLRLLAKHPDLSNLIVDAHKEIRKYFTSEKLSLKAVCDPEIPTWEQLLLSIHASSEADDALDKLTQFDEDWWVDASAGVGVNLCINLELE